MATCRVASRHASVGGAQQQINEQLAGQITRRVAPSVAPSTGCSIIIIILVFSYEHCTLIALYKYGDTHAPKPRGNSLPTKDNRTWVADQEPVNMKRLEP